MHPPFLFPSRLTSEKNSRMTIGPNGNTDVVHKKKEKFMVCNHCRAHGLKCNEASVCNECLLRKVPCVHHWCNQSQQTKDSCPGTSCRYAHQDQVDALAKPNAPRWIVLQGKIQDHLSEGQLRNKWPHSSAAELAACAAGADQRQVDGFNAMWRCVNNGSCTWDTVNTLIKCRCKEVEPAGVWGLKLKKDFIS